MRRYWLSRRSVIALVPFAEARGAVPCGLHVMSVVDHGLRQSRTTLIYIKLYN